MNKIYVEGQKATKYNMETLIAGSVGFTPIQFIFDSRWDNLIKTYQFTNGLLVYDVTQTEDIVNIPHEVLVEGDLSVTVVGIELDENNAEVIVQGNTNPITYIVYPSGYTGGGTNVPPVTPTLYNQILAIATSAETKADAVVASEVARAGAELTRVENENSRILEEGFRADAEIDRESAEGLRDDAEIIRLASEIDRGTAEGLRSSAEIARISSEGIRISQENTRQSNESDRVIEENARKSAETLRSNTELIRISQESDRGTNEGIRQSNEVDRQTAEGFRADAETDREEAEGDRESAEAIRLSSEVSRTDNEGDRISAEDIRLASEISRGQSETLRQQSEAVRLSSESTRASNETARITAETARAVFQAYNADTSYVVGNKVFYLGSSYICILNSTGNLPTNSSYWQIIAEKGAGGSPAGAYPTLVDLVNAFPTGDNNVYVIAADGKWYFWDTDEWTEGGVYQSTVLANNTVTNAKLAQMNTKTIKGNDTAGTANVKDLTVAEAKALLDIDDLETAVSAHLVSPLPHKMLVDGVTYNYGLSQTDGFVKFIYEEEEE